MKKSIFSTVIEYSPVFLVMVIVLVLSLRMHWQGDAVAFSLFIPAENEDFSTTPLRSIWDIWPSMCNHWHNSTGRFFTHAVVQLYCGFIGQVGFAICNAFVWGALILMILKMSKLRSYGFSLIALVSLLTFLVFFPLTDFQEQSFPFEPPHQINYVWMGLLNLGWVYCFLYNTGKAKKWYGLILFSIFSFLSGQSSEAFSVPICCAILVYAFRHKFKFPFRIYVMSICYGIGALLVVFAPGTFHRMGQESSWSLVHTLARMFSGLLMPLLWYTSFIVRRRSFPSSRFKWTVSNVFFLTAIIANYLMAFCIGMGSGIRALTCANLLIIVFVLANLEGVKIKPILSSVFVFLIICLGAYRWISIDRLNHKNILIETLYHDSDDGIVVLSDEEYLYQVREFIVRPHPFMMKERLIDPSKPNIKIRPQSMMALELNVDTNMLYPLSDQSWLMIQSKKHPKDFVIEKILLPGWLDYRLHERRIVWQDAYTVFDSTELWRAGIYINERPYIKSTVKIDGQ